MKPYLALPPILLGLLLGAGRAVAQCEGPVCPASETSHPAVVRVVNDAGTSRWYGSGTLVAKDETWGIVLTCAHLFRRTVGRVEVSFPDGTRYEARVLAADATWDLAALAIAPPGPAPVAVAEDHPTPGDVLTSCGYGPDGRFWCNRGRALGYARTAAGGTYETLTLSGFARDGDSGGPVLNQRGELVAVVWGTDGRTVEATYCGRICRFLSGLFCPNGCRPGGRPLVPVSPNPSRPGTVPPPVPAPPSGTSPTLGDHLDKLRQRIEGLTGEVESIRGTLDTQVERSDERMTKIETAVTLVGSLKERISRAEAAVGEDNLRAVARQVAVEIVADRGPGLAEKVLPGLLAALGWTGPPAVAAVFLARLGGLVLRRRVRRRREPTPAVQPGRPSSGGTKYDLNDDYAEQLARVYALSGRSPWGDVTLGREYDRELREAEDSSDAKLARWARQVRDRVAQRFHRIHGQSPTPAEPTREE